MGIKIGTLGTVRLNDEDITDLRWACFERDDWKCVVCLRPVYWRGSLYQRGHMAHISGRGAGGSDTLENVQTKCYECHIVSEHNGGKKVVPAKPYLKVRK